MRIVDIKFKNNFARFMTPDFYYIKADAKRTKKGLVVFRNTMIMTTINEEYALSKEQEKELVSALDVFLKNKPLKVFFVQGS